MRRKKTMTTDQTQAAARSLPNLMLENVNRYKMHYAKFRQVFGVTLKPYWCNLRGFDIVKFDDQVIKSGDGSVHDAVQARWGDTGVTLIQSLIAPHQAGPPQGGTI
jgi:hypothetical protein